jgi:YbbR domain-containing protein
MGKNNGEGNSWVVRIMALLVACALWLYVMNEQNPFTTRTFLVTLTKENLASDMVVHDFPENVKIKVSGQRSQVATISESSLKAFVDFSGAVKGLGTYSVQGKTPKGEIIEISPSILQLNLDTVGERTLEIEPRIVGVPNSGVTVGKMNLYPLKATVQGASSRIAEVGKVVVLIDISNKDKNFEDEAAVVAVSKDGREMYDIKVEPSKVHVSVEVLKQLATKSFPIAVDLSGKLPAGLKVDKIIINPDTVKLTAEPQLINNLTEIKTAPVVLDKLTGDVELKMPLNIPDKVLAEAHNVIVEIKLKKAE